MKIYTYTYIRMHVQIHIQIVASKQKRPKSVFLVLKGTQIKAKFNNNVVITASLDPFAQKNSQ